MERFMLKTPVGQKRCLNRALKNKEEFSKRRGHSGQRGPHELKPEI